MKQYKVIALSCGGLNNVFSSGDIVTEEDFASGDPEELVKEGFLKEIGEVEAKKKGSLLEQLKK